MRTRHFLLGWALVAALVGGAACGGKDRKSKPPTPPAAKKAVTTGIIVQLRLAVEAFDTIFDLRAQEQDLLPLLVHAWATFYGWKDPASDAKARYAFTEGLCRARLPELGANRDLHTCMDRLRVSLYDDLIWAIERYQRAGHPDKVGDFSLSRLLKDYRLRRTQFKQTLALRRQRRAARKLIGVSQCRLRQPLAPVLWAMPREINLNGFPVITTHKAPFTKLEEHELTGLRHQLENRLMESQPAGKQPEQLILAVDERLNGRVLLRLVGLISALGVSRVCLKVRRKGRFRVPCCLSIRVSPKIVRPRPALELDRRGLHRVTERDRRKIAIDRKALARAVNGLKLPDKKAGPPLVVLPDVAPGPLYRTVTLLLEAGRRVELIPAGRDGAAQDPAAREPAPRTPPGKTAPNSHPAPGTPPSVRARPGARKAPSP